MWRTNDVYYTNVARVTQSPFWTTTNKLPKIYTANHATFTILVHSRYTRMAGFGRREIEYIQALCIYNKYKECYSVIISIFYIKGNLFHYLVYPHCFSSLVVCLSIFLFFCLYVCLFIAILWKVCPFLHVKIKLSLFSSGLYQCEVSKNLLCCCSMNPKTI